MLLACFLAIWPLGTFAQATSSPAERYVDPDPSAMAFHPPPGSKARYRQVIEARLRKNPRDAAALAQRAYSNYAGGYVEQGERDYARAVEVSAQQPQVQRQVLWSWGWSSFNAGQPARALEQWQRSEILSGVRPFWVPYTYALAYWQLGNKELAIAYYAAAVRSDPAWGTEQGFGIKTDHWRQLEREIGQQVLSAWQAQAR